MNEVLLAASRLQVAQADMQAFAVADALFESTRRERLAAMRARSAQP